jgi:hypothetical protein
MFEQITEALKTYDWGTDPKVLQPIEDAIVATRADAAARKELESRLAEVLKGAAPRAAKDVACRMLKTIGSASSVPTLAALLPDDKLSHMARYALESMPAPEAAQALLAALPSLTGSLKIGVISSLGVRAEAAAVAPLQGLLADPNPAIAAAAAHALGAIASPPAAAALAAAKPTATTQLAIADASLNCADAALANGQKAEAKATYQRLLDSKPSKAVALAATHGLQACDEK